ncbi:MAG: tetratricopeptide repeat protein, partial [Saprospiraceae bacterium]|nr:tetratricopeptide repeat protein [Saprospiraceae bacterium]
SEYADRAVMILREKVESPDDLAESLFLLGGVAQNDETRLEHENEGVRILSSHHGPEHPLTLNARFGTASTLNNLGRYPESLEIFDQVIPLMERELGPLHDETLTAMNNRAITLSRMGEIDAAIMGFRKVLGRYRQVYGNEHRSIANLQQNIGAMLNRLERYPEAIEALNEAARIFEIVNLPGNYSTAYPHITLADIHGKLGNVDRLESHASKALELLEGNLPEDHHAILKCRCLLGDALIRQGRQEQGVAIIEAVLESLSGRQVPNPRLVDECAAVLETTN